MFEEFIRKHFLIKEIVSKEGVVHFRRYRLLATPWFNIYIHNILHSDEDKHGHDHPWHFMSIILRGEYLEQWFRFSEDWKYRAGYAFHINRRSPRSVIRHHAEDFHKITLLTPSVWTLVFTSGRARSLWGFQTENGWIDFMEYRKLKNEGRLP